MCQPHSFPNCKPQDFGNPYARLELSELRASLLSPQVLMHVIAYRCMMAFAPVSSPTVASEGKGCYSFIFVSFFD